jgi:hypothetical protein
MGFTIRAADIQHRKGKAHWHLNVKPPKMRALDRNRTVTSPVRRDQPLDNPEVREEMKAIASKRRRFGYRRIGVLLERKGMIMNHKKLDRLYTEEKLGVRGNGTLMPMGHILKRKLRGCPSTRVFL